MNGFILVKGENHEGYAIIRMFQTEEEVWEYACSLEPVSGCDYYAVIEIESGIPID